MSSEPKTTFTKFVQDWTGRAAWVQQQGIPFNDFKQAVQYDYNRMTNPNGYGEPMSNNEAFDSLLALKDGKNPFATPADNVPSVSQNPLSSNGVFGAIHNDLSGLFSGLSHLPGAFIDLAKETGSAAWSDITHPSDASLFGGTPQNAFQRQQQAANRSVIDQLLNFIPAYNDIHNAFSGPGRSYLAQHPVSDILDLGGVGRILDGAESALRAAGISGAADTLDALPDHPFSTAMKTSFNWTAQRVAAVATVRDLGIRFAGSLGQLPDQVSTILRPSAAAQEVMRQIPWPDMMTYFKDWKFGDAMPGTKLTTYVKDILDKYTEQDIDQASQMFTYSETLRDGQKFGDQGSRMTPAEFLRSPTITKEAKTLYRSFVRAADSLQYAEMLYKNTIHEVRNLFTNEIGYTRVGGDYDRFVERFNKLMARAEKNNNRLANNIQTIYTNIRKLKSDDANVPRALRLPTDKGPVTMEAALRRVSDYYTPRTANDLSKGFTGDLSKRDAFRAHYNRLVNLFGTNGKIPALIPKVASLKSIAEGDEIVAAIKGIKRSLNSLQVPHDEVYEWLNEQLDDISSSVKEVQRAQLTFRNLKEASDDSSKRVQAMRKQYEKKWNQLTQQKYAAIVQRSIAQKVLDYVEEHYREGEIHVRKLKDGTEEEIEITPEMMAEAVEEAINRNFTNPTLQLLLRGNFPNIVRESWEQIDELKREGYDPVFVVGTRPGEESALRSPSLGTDISKQTHRSIQYERSKSLSGVKYHPLLGIPKEAIDIYRHDIINHLINDSFVKMAKRDQDLIAEGRMFFRGKGVKDEDIAREGAATVTAKFAALHDYVPWDPTNPLDTVSPNDAGYYNNPNRLWIKKYNLALMKKQVDFMNKDLNKLYDSSLNLYRDFVLYASPRFAAHVTLGGGMMTVLRMDEPIISTVKFLRDAWKTAADPDHMPMMMSKGFSEQDLAKEIVKDPLASHQWLVGRTLARLYEESFTRRVGENLGGKLNAYKAFLEHVSNTQRVLRYMDKLQHIDPSEITQAVKDEAKFYNADPREYLAAMAANKVLADVQAMSPMERGILSRLIMPFYGWTKHILRYVLTLPRDNPYRVMFLSQFANMAVGDDSSLPEYLFRLLFLGQPNAQGNVTVLDTRQWNPFRDVANYMTWGGWVSQLSPPIAAALTSAFGIDPATGGIDLYPDLTYDSFYGSDTSQATGGNFFFNLAKQISPQIDTLAAVADRTSTMREEAQQDPGKLPYLIADSLGMPWIPYQINLKQIGIKKTLDEYDMASAAVTSALTQNSMAPLSGYSGYLPYDGYEVTKNYLSNLISAAKTYDKEIGLQLPALDVISLPYSSPFFPEFLLGPGANQNQPS